MKEIKPHLDKLNNFNKDKTIPGMEFTRIVESSTKEQ